MLRSLRFSRPDHRNVLTPTDFLRALHVRGARRIRRVHFRDNRSTIWSLTCDGTVLNVHAAYRAAPDPLLDAFATLATAKTTRSRAWRDATDRVRNWPALAHALEDARRRHADERAEPRGAGIVPCCGTPRQRNYLRRLYDYLNHTRFGGRLPDDIPLRLSRRMRTALGHMLPGADNAGDRRVAEIALNVDLLLPGNGAERLDTLLHEMAHAADYLETGARGHGASWRAWARRIGCRPTTLYDRPVRFRRRRSDPVSRVPPLPPALRLGSSAESGPELGPSAHATGSFAHPALQRSHDSVKRRSAPPG